MARLASYSGGGGKRRWTTIVFIFTSVFVVAEILYLGRLDMAKNADLVKQWTTFYFESISSNSAINEVGDDQKCMDYLEKADGVSYSRDFASDPILVDGQDEDWSTCSVGCRFGHVSGRKPDAKFGFSFEADTSSVLRSMESAQYYSENNVDLARGRGYQVVMTTSLSSDVPVGYFSWAEYDIMAPVMPKTEEALAAAFISNCGARNFRLQALNKLGSLVKIDSYGTCNRNRHGDVDKVEALKRYKFSLAFENSNEEDYVTEKFFQSLVAGTIPIVIGAPNIQDFAPSNVSILHIRNLDDVNSVAETMKHLASNPDAFNQSIRWKYEGPSDSFKALVDMAAVHSSCRLCIHLATKINEKEESSSRFHNRPCKCKAVSGTFHHLYVRERGRFKLESIFLRCHLKWELLLIYWPTDFVDACMSSDITIKALESSVLSKFKHWNHVPIWKTERPESIRGGDELKVYRIYPVGMTQRQALYTFRFNSDNDLQRYIEKNPCAKFEVIFV